MSLLQVTEKEFGNNLMYSNLVGSALSRTPGD